MISKSLLALATLALATTSALAANDIGATVSKDGLKSMVPRASGTYTRAGVRDPKSSVIFSNVGTDYPKGLYFCCYGGTIGGPTSQVGQVWQAEAFTPATSVTVTQVDAAVGFVNGVNGVTLGIYSDASGVPGTALFSKDASGLGTFGACCTLATVKTGKKGVALSASTQYWIVVSTDKKTTTTWDAWNMNSTDQIDPLTSAFNEGSGWSASEALPAFSFDVLGN